ncbi:ATP-binding response regulator [Cupriavidus basilensis]|uniref:ATP-binding response regulator n=1 Tax=Cupriavidus basilensis TaxID=68895 RepID=UPI001E2ACDFB|nr:hybrid sensor histidine kinase/response regulator [Cupriavidus basilensis]
MPAPASSPDPTARTGGQAAAPRPCAEGQVEAAMVGLLYRQSNAVMFANFIIPLPALYVLQRGAPLTLLLGWLAVVYLLTAVRIFNSVQYFRHARAEGTAPLTPASLAAPRSLSPRAWAQRFTVMSWLSGLLWGWLGSAVFLPPDPTLVAFCIIIIAGMTCGAIPSLSARPLTYVGTMTAMVLPFMLNCLWQGGPLYNVFFAFALCLACVNLYYCRVTYRSVLEGVRLRFENVALIGQLERERDRATAADNAKTRFLAAASHDLRQPVHALGLFTATLSSVARRGDVPAAQAIQVAARIDGTLAHMGDLLDGLLNVSRLDAGLMPVARRPVALGALLRELGGEYAGQARQRGGELRVVATEAWIDTDPALLRRILDNLLSNALRYAPGGKILLGARRRPHGMEIQVVDQGPGIACAQQARVFEEFAQLPETQRHPEEGLGLGLAIVRRLAALLGHEIGLRSVPGRGARFSVLVAYAAAPAAPAPVPAPAGEDGAPSSQHRLGIMLVDDDARVLAALSELLALWGHAVYAGATAPQACAAHAAAAAQGPAPVDLLIVDYRLAGGVTGFAAIAALRGCLGAEVPALVVTGDTAPDRLRELDASGFRILHKPLAAHALREAIHAAVLPERGRQAA